MRTRPALTVLALALVAGCSTSNPLAPDVDLSALPADLPRGAIADLDPGVQAQLRRGLQAIDRRLGPVCTPTQVAQAKEALVLFGWATTSQIPDPRMQAYVDRRGPELRAARQTLSPACEAQVQALVKIVRETS